MKKAREIYGYVLAAIILLGFFALIVCIIFKVIPTENKEIAISLFGTLSVLVTLVVKFFFDGNKETAAKNEMIYKSTPPPADNATTRTETDTTTTTKPTP